MISTNYSQKLKLLRRCEDEMRKLQLRWADLLKVKVRLRRLAKTKG